MWSLITFGGFLVYTVYAQSDKKVPYTPGSVCNIEAFMNSRRELMVNRYFCVKDSLCRKGITRLPLMDHDNCDSFMSAPYNSPEKMVCCHQEEIHEDLAPHLQKFAATPIYTPGLKSFMMCKEFSHAICGPSGSYCDAEAEVFRGLPSAIAKYPHTALIGYLKSDARSWNWFCQGTIISKTYVLTLWDCVSDGKVRATHVKVGESRHCEASYCPDNVEEQTLKIYSGTRQVVDGYMGDLFLIELATEIVFNRNVRPACLFYKLFNRPIRGWFARYSKPEGIIKTYPGKIPVFMNPMDENIVAFKVKSYNEARITFSKTGLPYRNEFHYEIMLGTMLNTMSMITRSGANRTENILDAEHFRGFWIRMQPHEIQVGKEDSASPFLVYTDNSKQLNLRAMGFSTPYSRGQWIVHDYRISRSLHDFEMDTKYADECKQAIANETNLEEDGEINKTSMFCGIGKNIKPGGIQFKPCTNDWGGPIQVLEKRLFCMWQIFGVFLRRNIDDNCADVEKPTLFKSLNRPGVLSWIEDVVFNNFSELRINLERPECVRRRKPQG